ncbi:uncharacterized protein LOC143297079 [Babylonia areolata]|uniref:uncharacterized protein LOC143297079 n=1 Tax=Babylonia areolata TaxID=304850 RepID=UPI003FD6534E
MLRSDEKKGVDLDSVLEQLGGRGRYQVIQLMLNIFACFINPNAIIDIVFTGYKPDYRCNQVDNVSHVEAYLPDDVTNFTLHDIQYHQCSIDVTVNTSGTSSTHSLPCVAGVNFSMPSDTSFVTEWSLVCDKAGLGELTQTGVFGGQLLGCVATSILADRYGRKKVYVTSTLVTMVCLLAMALVPNFYIFLGCKVCVGFFAKGMSGSSYIIFMELIDREWRSVGSTMCNMLWVCGSIVMAIVAYCMQGLSWRYLSLALSSVYVYSLLLPCFLDESLRWLLATGNIEEAERILKKACRMNGKDFEKIQTLLKRQVFTGNNSDDRDQSDSSPTIIQITKSSVKNNGDTTEDQLNDEKTDGISAERRGSGSDQRDPEEGGPGNDSDEGSSQLMPETEVFSAKITSSLYYYSVMLGSAKLSGNRFLNFGLLNLLDIPDSPSQEKSLREFPLNTLMPTTAEEHLPLSQCDFRANQSTTNMVFVLRRQGQTTAAGSGGGQGLMMTLATAAQYVGMFALTGSFVLLFVFYMEVFPTTIRIIGTGAAGMVSRISSMAAPFLLLWAEETPWAPGVMVGCLFCLASASIWLLPETRHRKLPDTIEEMQAWKNECQPSTGGVDNKQRDVTLTMSRSDGKRGVDLDSILEHLGGRGRFQVIQLMLSLFPWFLAPSLLLDIVFIGYQPDHQCSQVDNISQVEAYLPDDVTNFTLHDIQYHQCSIDVTVNTSGTSSTHSLPCVAGVNFSMPSHTSFVTEWSLVCDKAGLAELTQTGVFGGQVAGIATASILADRFGRKKVYVASGLIAMLPVFAKALAPNYYFFLVCKICGGFFTMGMDHTAYTMFMELIAPEWRSFGSAVGTVVWTCGSLFMATVAYCMQGVSWRYLSLAFSSVYVFGLLLPWLLDESLRWLLATGNIEEAERILKKACRMNGKDFENIQTLLKRQVFTGNNSDDRDQSDSSPTIIQITKSSVKNNGDTTEDKLNDEKTDGISAERRGSGSDQRDPEEGGPGNDSDEESSQLMPKTEVFSAKYTVLDLFRHRVVLVPLLVVVFVWVMLNTYYYTVMLQSARLSGNRFLNFALLNIQDIPSTLLALFFLQRFNRRPLACIYGLLSGSCLLISVGLATLGGGQGVTLTLATAAQYVGLFAVTGSYILLFVYYLEVFPTTIRAVGTGTAGMAAYTANMGAPFLLLWAEETPWAPGVMVGCLCCLTGVSIWLLPETRHRKLPDTIEEIQAWKNEVPDVQ